MAIKTAAKFETHLKRLFKYALPEPDDFTVRLVPNLLKKTGDIAWTTVTRYKKRRNCLIEIDAGLCEYLKNAMLMHEWAHALIVKTEYDDGIDHGPAHGLSSSFCYRIAAEGWKPKDPIYVNGDYFKHHR